MSELVGDYTYSEKELKDLVEVLEDILDGDFDRREEIARHILSNLPLVDCYTRSKEVAQEFYDECVSRYKAVQESTSEYDTGYKAGLSIIMFFAKGFGVKKK